MTDTRTIEIATERLAAIYTRHRQIRGEAVDRLTAMAISGTLPAFAPTPLRNADAAQLPSRLDSVTDAGSGLCYAAWVIGEGLCASGGNSLMQAVYDRFSGICGPRGASWLDHRWDGVRIEGQGWTA